MSVLDMFEYENGSYRRQLKKLYAALESTNLPYEVGAEYRKAFFARMRGRFIQVSRLKKDMQILEILEFLKIPTSSQRKIERGFSVLSDREFTLLITYLGCAQELPVFKEKLEKAMATTENNAQS